MARRLLALLIPALAWALVAGLSPAASQAATANLAITKDAPSEVEVGSDLTYTVTVTNLGPEPASGVIVTDDLPSGVIPASATSDKGTCTVVDPVVCTIGSLDMGATATVTIVATPTKSGSAQNVATVSSSSSDPVPADNSATATTTVRGSSCTVVGTQGDDTLVGTSGADVLCGLRGNDSLDGRDGNDTLYGGGGADTLDGGDGGDTLDGGSGPDTATFAGAPGRVTVDLGDGTASGWGLDDLDSIEHLVGSGGNDILEGSADANTITGGAGVDLLFGRAGADRLEGGAAGDYLDGGPGTDTLDGGAGTDACRSGKRISCLSTSPTDGNDTSGKLDVGRVRSKLGSSRPKWTVVTKAGWTIHGMWDEGYLLVFLDTKGGSAMDFYGMARSNGSRMVGHLFKVRGGVDKKKGKLTVSHPTGKTVRITIPLSKVTVGASRTYYRWSVRTLHLGCVKVCIDAVPGASKALPQPLP